MFKQCVTLFSFLLLLVVAAHPAQAQKNFRPGYIVRPGGDTLRGEVDARGQQRMAKLCIFRSNASAEPVHYSPGDLKGYGFSSGTRYETNQLPALEGAGPVLFLQVLAHGKTTLYNCVDEDGRTHYAFRVAGGAVTELLQTTQTMQQNGGLVQEQTYPFRQVLSRAFTDCPAVQHMLVSAELKESQLIAIFNRYNTCAPGQTAAVATARKTIARFGVMGGAQSATSTLNDGGEVALRSSLRPVVGLGLLLNPAAFNSKLSIRLEALYQKQLHEGQYQRNASVVVSSLKSDRNAQIALQTLRIPVLLRYTWPKGRLQPYVQAGVEMAILLDSNQALIIEDNQALSGGNVTTSFAIAMRPLCLGLTGGVGLLIPAGRAGALQLEARIGGLENASQTVNTLDGATTVSFLLGYNFGR